MRRICFAQNEQQQINDIKRNISFIYATGTSSVSSEEASNNAKDLLALEIEQWLKECSVDSIAGYVAKSKESLSQISTQRGRLSRVLAYVNKIDILPYYKQEEVMVVNFGQPGQTTDSVAINAIPVASADTTASNEIVTTPMNESVEETEKQDIISTAYTPTQKEQEMLAVETFTALNEYVNLGRKNGTITQVGKYSNLPTTDAVYVFIHNKQGEIPACLKVAGETCINLKTGTPDLISNYKGCGAIWIKTKD